jgi:hypothetical protein
MRIVNRSYRRNMILYIIVNVTWFLLLLIAVVLIPGNLILTLAEIGIWSILAFITVRSILKMPSAIEVDGKEVVVHLIRGEVILPSSDIIEMRYDRRDCTLSVISMGSSHRFNDLKIDTADQGSLSSFIGSRGWGSIGPGGRSRGPR